MDRELKATRLKELPVKIYHTKSEEYSKDWHNDYAASAYFNIARDEDDNLQAHCILLSVTPAEIVNHFTIIKRSEWMLSVCVFESSECLVSFIKNANGCIISATLADGVEII